VWTLRHPKTEGPSFEHVDRASTAELSATSADKDGMDLEYFIPLDVPPILLGLGVIGVVVRAKRSILNRHLWGAAWGSDSIAWR
jgi:hypothetical protein